MAWTTLSFPFGSILTSTKMTQLYDNLTALADGATGAPPIQTAALEQTGGSEAVTQATIRASAVGQGELKTTTATQSATAGSQATGDILPTGGSYSLFMTIGGLQSSQLHWATNGSSSFNNTVSVYNSDSANNYTVYLFSRYVQASPPYNYGAGDVPLFVLVMLDKNTREVLATYAAEDPPWAYHGPHILHPVIGKLQKYLGIWGKDPKKIWAGKDNMTRGDYLTAIRKLRSLTEDELVSALSKDFTMDEKMVDMNIVPHLFNEFDPNKHVVVQIDPLTKLCEDLHCLMTMPGAPDPSSLLHDGSIKIIRDIQSARIQPGVIMVEASL